MLKGIVLASKSYGLAQLTVGVILGVVLGTLIGGMNWPAAVAIAIVMPMGLPMVLFFYILGLRYLGEDEAIELDALEPRAEAA
jgi:hypothetical protein